MSTVKEKLAAHGLATEVDHGGDEPAFSDFAGTNEHVDEDWAYIGHQPNHPTLPAVPLPASWDKEREPGSRFERSELDKIREVRSEAEGRQRCRDYYTWARAEIDRRRREREAPRWLRVFVGVAGAWLTSTIFDRFAPNESSESLSQVGMLGAAAWGGAEGADIVASWLPSRDRPQDLVPMTPPVQELVSAGQRGLDPAVFERAWYEEYTVLLGRGDGARMPAVDVRMGPVGLRWKG